MSLSYLQIVDGRNAWNPSRYLTWSADFATTAARNPNSSSHWPWPSQPRPNLAQHVETLTPHDVPANHWQIMGECTKLRRDKKLLGQSALCISSTSSDMLVDAHTWMIYDDMSKCPKYAGPGQT